jgi:hypothetical protein
MTITVAAAVLAMALFAAVAPRIAARLSPAVATRMLALGSVVVAGCTVCVLGVLALTWLGQLPLVATIGPWSTSSLDALDPIPESLAAISLGLLTAAGVRTALRLIRRIRALAEVRRTHHGTDTVVVIDSDQPEAFATPSPAGRIVVTSALLKVLTPTERQVVLAHEQSHLTHWHTWWVLAADLSQAVNPLLGPTVTSVRHSIERWADEDAAAQVGDRQLVARTIARTALLKHEARTHAELVTQSATGGEIPRRVKALLVPPPRRRPFVLAALAVVLLSTVVATAAVERTGDAVFDQAALPTAHHH